MKKLLVTIMMLPLLLATPSCSTTGGTPSAKTVAYRTLKTTGEGVDSSMKGFAAAVVRGMVPADVQVQVSDLHEKYRVAFSGAVQAARFNYEAATPDNVSALAAQLIALITTYVH